MPEYQDYPVTMVHPHARKASAIGVAGTEKRDALGRPIPGEFFQYTGQADYMPPVTVNNADQEAFHMAQGYRRGGQGDAAAYANQVGRGAADPIPVIEEYPKWVNGELVNSAVEERALLAKTPATVADLPAEEPQALSPGVTGPKPGDTITLADGTQFTIPMVPAAQIGAPRARGRPRKAA